MITKKIKLLVAGALLSVLLCGCIGCTQRVEMTKNESDVVMIYNAVDFRNVQEGILTDEEHNVLKAYRTLNTYMQAKYTNTSYTVVGVHDSVKNEDSYAFFLEINGGQEVEYIVSKDSKTETYSVTSDGYLMT